MDYKKLDVATKKDHFPLHFMDQMIELARKEFYCFHDRYHSYDKNNNKKKPA